MDAQDVLAAGGSAQAAADAAGLCPHRPPCPPAHSHDRAAARTVASHPEQGWSLLCNGVICFDDGGELLPGGRPVSGRPAATRPLACAGQVPA
jgi:hypothetical protein